MTDEEIAAEQELMRQQAITHAGVKVEEFVNVVEISDEEAQKVTPLDLLDSKKYTDRATRDARYDICKGCERLTSLTKQCRECHCVMPMKTWLKDAHCDLGKW